MKRLDDVSNSTLPGRCDGRPENEEKWKLKLRPVAVFCLSSVCRPERLEAMGESVGECVRWTAIHPELRERFQISPLTFFWAQRSPGTEVAQNWHRPPRRCQGQPLCWGVAGAQRCFVFRSHLTSWFGKGGWLIINHQTDPILHCMRTRNQASGQAYISLFS